MVAETNPVRRSGQRGHGTTRAAATLDMGIRPYLDVALMCALVAVAAPFRLAALAQRGLIYWDEGKFALEGIRLQALLQSPTSRQVAVLAGKTIGTAKPTHALLLAVSYLVLGVHDYAPLFLNAVCSILQVPVLYLIARWLFGRPVAVVSALFLAVSEYEVIYARSALSESDGCLVLLLAVLILVRSWPPTGGDETSRHVGSTVLGAACVLGLAFTVNYRLIVYIVIVVAVDVIYAMLDAHPVATGLTASFPPLPSSCRVYPPSSVSSAGSFTLDTRAMLRLALYRAGLWLGGLAVAPILWQLADIATRAHGLVLFRNEFNGDSESYFRQVVYQLHEGKQSVVHFSPMPYVDWYVLRQGWPAAGLLLIGIGLAAWHGRTARGTRPWVMVASLVVLPYAVYVFAPFIVPRNLEAALPFASVLCGAAAVWIAQHVPYRSLGLASGVTLVLLVSIIGGNRAWNVTSVRSGFRHVAGYLRQHGERGALVDDEVMRFYLRGGMGPCTAPSVPRTNRSVLADARLGYSDLVVDRFDAHAIERRLHGRVRLVHRYRVDEGSPPGEDLVRSENEHVPSSQVDYIYLLHVTGVPRPRGRRELIPCNRNIVVSG